MRKHIGFIAIAVAMLSTAAGTQTRYATTAPGVWKPWAFTADSDVLRRLRARAADVSAVDASLRGLASILKTTPGFSAPIGFSVETTGALDLESFRPGQPDVETLPIPSSLDFGAFGISEFTRNGKNMRDDTGETTMVIFFVNQLALPLFFETPRVPEFEALDTDVALMAAPQPDLFGMPRYGHTLVLKKNPAPVWAAVSLDEALRLAVKGIEARLAESRDVVARLQKSRDELVDPAERAKRMAGYTLAASLSKDPKTLESLMQAEERLQAQAGPLTTQVADATARAAEVEREVAAASATIAALPADRRAAPACYAARESLSLARFQSEPRSGCVALVRPNWAMFNPSLPRSAPQVLVIAHYEGCLGTQNLPHPGGCVANRTLLETMDKQAILDWLR